MVAWYDYTPVFDFRKKFDFATYPVQGEDIPMLQDTPITAPFLGTVTSTYYDAGGGQVIIKVDDPNILRGHSYYYFVHLDQILVKQGQRVPAGYLIGYSGGQNVGGSHPAARNYSSGPHLEIGISPTNSIPYTLATITPDLNPDWILDYAKSIKLSATGQDIKDYSNVSSGTANPGNYQGSCTCPTGYTQITNGLGGKICRNNSFPFDSAQCQEIAVQTPLQQISSFLSNLQQVGQWLSDPIRIIKLLVGMGLLFVSLLLLINPASQMARSVKGVFPK